MTRRATAPQEHYDVVVVGGGPAGMMAAARAQARGRRVLLLEKNLKLGKKLLITGGGRCNITNNKPIVRDMLRHYHTAGQFLFSTFMQHGVRETLAWFSERGLTTIEENEGRLFPSTEKAESVWEVLRRELDVPTVTIRTNAAVADVTRAAEATMFRITLHSGDVVYAPSVILATGGTSRPDTGSTGDAWPWLRTFGHTVFENTLALVPLKLNAPWTKRASGVTLRDVKLTVRADNKKHKAVTGKLLFTHVGVSGPTVLNLSREIGELLTHSNVTIDVDCFPQEDHGTLRTRVTTTLAEHSNKKLRNALSSFLPPGLVGPFLEDLGIDGETPGHSVATSDRKAIVQHLKAWTLPVAGLLGSDKAVVSSGGVALPEVNFKTMESRIVPGLYLVGDVLNIDRPSGGYSLQLCWSTGFVAGDHS